MIGTVKPPLVAVTAPNVGLSGASSASPVMVLSPSKYPLRVVSTVIVTSSPSSRPATVKTPSLPTTAVVGETASVVQVYAAS